MSFQEISDISQHFRETGDRKITLNFALADEYPINPAVLTKFFSPEDFLIKITPLNPTYSVKENKLKTYISTEKFTTADEYAVIADLKKAGYEVLLSIGELDENKIGSNCGQYIQTHLNNEIPLQKSYQWIKRN